MVDRERGQLVLIGAVTVAIAVLGAVMLLNTVHSSPAAVAETDARSVDNAEATIQEVERDLEMVALNRSNDRSLEYVANSTELNQSVDKYQSEYLNLSTKDTSELVSIDYNKTASEDGAFAYNNSIDENDISGSEDVIDGSNRVQFYMNVSEFDLPGSGNQQIIRTNQDDLRFEKNDDKIVGWGFDCNVDFDNDVPIEIIMIDGEGEIRSADTGNVYCTSEYDDWEDVSEISLFNLSPSTTIEYSYQISASAGTCQNSPCIDNVAVVPAFDIVYQNPDVTAASTITLWGES